MWGLVKHGLERLPMPNAKSFGISVLREVPRFHPRTGRGPLVVRSLACCGFLMFLFEELRIQKTKSDSKCRKLSRNGTKMAFPLATSCLVLEVLVSTATGQHLLIPCFSESG